MAPTSSNDTTGAEWKLACADFTFPLLPHDKVLDLIACARTGWRGHWFVRGTIALVAIARI